MSHAGCWANIMQNTPESATGAEDPECPNCRGPGHTIAIWSFIDPTVMTQWVGEEQAPNELQHETSLTEQLAPTPAVVIETSPLATEYNFQTPMSKMIQVGSDL